VKSKLFIVVLLYLLIVMVIGLTIHATNQSQRIRALQLSNQRINQIADDMLVTTETLLRHQLPKTNIQSPPPVSITQTFRAGDWDYIVTTFNPGTRSEGTNTILAKDANLIEPEELTDLTATTKTPWGLMQWVGDIDARQHVWINSGWILVKPSGVN
jgi:Tfp pilus assembly protein PilX